jgi:hypothetical protein
MKRLHFFLCLTFLFLLVPAGIASADSATNTTTTNITVNATTTTPEKEGGSIFFDTIPSDATIWLDNVNIGTSPFTYSSDKSATFIVLVRKKMFEDYTGTVTVSDGKRVVFYARLTPVSHALAEENTYVAPVTTATTIRKSTMNIPTPWPTTTPQSPLDPALVIGAAALGTGFWVIRRR